MRILVTGSRDWNDRERVRQELLAAWFDLGEPEDIVIVHGGARGADDIAGAFAARQGWKEEVHYAEWDEYGKVAGPIRNQKMVKRGADIVLAFLKNNSKGTKSCIRFAQNRGLEVRVIESS